MKDENKTKKQLIDELKKLRRQITKLQKSETKHTEIDLTTSEREERFRSLVETASDAIITVNQDGNIISWNSAAEAIFGYTADEIIGKLYTIIIPERFRENTIKSMKEMPAMDKSIFKGKFFEFPGLKKDGGEFSAESSYALWKAKEGIFITAIIRDITQRKATENEIKETRDFLENIFKTSPDGIIISDPEGVTTTTNEAMENMLGCSRDELIGKHFREFSTKGKEYEEIIREFVSKLLNEGVATGCDYAFTRKDGGLIDVELSSVLLKDNEGNITGSVSIVRDITARKKAEEEIKKARNSLDNIIKTSTDGIMVTAYGGQIAQVNEALEKMLGYSSDELIEKYPIEFVPQEEEYFKRGIEYVTKLFEKGAVAEKEFIWVKKDGSLIDVEINAALLKDKDGTVRGSVANIRDITERKRVEEALQSEKNFSYMIIETADVLMATLDLEEKVTYFNKRAEEITGYSRSDVMGKDLFEIFFPGGDRIGFTKRIQDLMQDKKVGPVDVSIRTKSGGERTISHRSTPLKDAEGNIIGILGVGLDVTEKRRMEKQLIQSEKLRSLGELAGGVAHDFNNVLAAILGRAQLLKMNAELLEKNKKRGKSLTDLKKGLEIIEKAAQDGAETVRRIQEFARRRDDDRYFTSFNINEVIENSLEFTRLRWKDDAELKGIKINIEKKLLPIPSTLGSAAELREVFINLINNAVDAMPKGGQITIQTSEEDNTIFIKVGDTGVGIPNSIKDMIFDPFFTTKGPQSSGLGMSVSYGIIDRHRGTIMVDSTESKGTTFTITLPISEQELKEEEKDKFIAGEQKKARILVIEDEGEVCQLLSDILIDGGHEVETASDGNQGLNIFKKNEFDLVFTDLGMPGMSGWQVAEKIKKINDKVPIALITGWNISFDKSVMSEGYVDFVIQKPFEMNQVLMLVQEGMALRDRFKAC